MEVKLRQEGDDSSLGFNRQRLYPGSQTTGIRNHNQEPGKQRFRGSERGTAKGLVSYPSPRPPAQAVSVKNRDFQHFPLPDQVKKLIEGTHKHSLGKF